MYKKILVPIDLSHKYLSDHIIPHIKIISMLGTKEIHFITVIPDYSMFQGFEFNREQEKLFDSKIRTDETRNSLKNEISKFDFLNQNIFSHVRVGVPRDKIIEVSEEINPDIIIISSRNPSFETKYLLGSTADAVVRYSKFSVLVIR